MTRIEPLMRGDRAALCRILMDEDDFPQNLLYLYGRPAGPGENFLAWRGDRIHGLLTGVFRHDFANDSDFDGFDYPPAPHAWLSRLHVIGGARREKIGRDLVVEFAAEALERGCSFAGGSLDSTSDQAGRRAFFRQLGFTVGGRGNFGAKPADILAR